MADDEIDAMLEAPFEGNKPAAAAPASEANDAKVEDKPAENGDGDADAKSDEGDGQRDTRRDKKDRSRSRSPKRRRSRSRSPKRRKSRSRSPRRRRRSRSKSRDRSRRRRSRSRSPRRDRGSYRRGRYRRSRSRSPRRSPRRSPPRRRRGASPSNLSTPERDMRTIVVMQLARKCTPADLEEFFEENAGKIRDVRMIQDRNSRRPKGIAYVEFVDLESVTKAHTLAGQRVLGVPIMILPTQSEKNRMAAQKSKEPTGPTRLQVTNLPPQIMEPQLRMIFESFGTISDCKVTKGPSEESPSMATVQYADPQSAQVALEQLNNFVVVDRPIKIGLAAGDLSLAPSSLGSFDKGDDPEQAGIAMTAAARMQLMSNLAGGLPPPPPGAPAAAAAAVNEVTPTLSVTPLLPPPPVIIPPVPQSIIPAAAAAAPVVDIEGASDSPTEFVLLQNMFDPEKETDPDWHLDIRDAVLEECSKYGGIVHIFVDINTKGWVYLKYQAAESAAKAQGQLNGRFFAGAMIVAYFLTAEAYHAKFPDAAAAAQVLTVEE